MGYLDNSTVTVDAILTKQGRRKLAQGQTLGVSYFSLTDTGIDYNLWNTDHPSGSAYYGEAIEDLPQLEALPNAGYFMRNKLVTLNKDTTAMPVIVGLSNHAFGQTTTIHPYTPTLQNHDEPTGYDVVIPDISQVDVSGGSEQTDFSPNVQSFMKEQEIENVKVYRFQGTFNIAPKPIFTTSGNSMTLTFLSVTTGAYKSVQITWDDNLIQAPISTDPVG